MWPYKKVDGGIRFDGVQLRNESPNHVWPIEDEAYDLIAIRVPPGKVWSGNGRPWRYCKAEIRVFQLDKQRKLAKPCLTILVQPGVIIPGERNRQK